MAVKQPSNDNNYNNTTKKRHTINSEIVYKVLLVLSVDSQKRHQNLYNLFMFVFLAFLSSFQFNIAEHQIQFVFVGFWLGRDVSFYFSLLSTFLVAHCHTNCVFFISFQIRKKKRRRRKHFISLILTYDWLTDWLNVLKTDCFWSWRDIACLLFCLHMFDMEISEHWFCRSLLS